MPSAAMTSPAGREYKFDDRDFSRICSLVSEHTGISLSEAKRDLVYGRLVRRLRALKLDSFERYCELVSNGGDDEVQHFANAITTNLTSFFREQHHFDYLREQLVPEVVAQRGNVKRLRIWSAGCSTGEEVYSLAITLRELANELLGWDVRLLATDIDSQVLATASRGVYDEGRVEAIPQSMKKRWFLNGKGANAGTVRVTRELRDMVTFRHLNLMQTWPMTGPFDAVFCRNVVIYFDKDTQRKLFNRMAEMIRPGGHLFIGHSETLYRVSERFESIGRTVYRRTS